MCWFLIGSASFSAECAEYGREETVLLAQAIESAAHDESYTVMLAVASVFVNRMNDSAYPDSLGAVIADSGIVPVSEAPSSSALRAASDALRGFDPTSGALRYERTDKTPQEKSQGIKLGTDGWIFY